MNKVENRIGYHSGGAVGRNGEFLIGAVVLGQKISGFLADIGEETWSFAHFRFRRERERERS